MLSFWAGFSNICETITLKYTLFLISFAYMHTPNKEFKVKWNPYFWPSFDYLLTLCPRLNDGFVSLVSSDSPCMVTKLSWWLGAGRRGRRKRQLPSHLPEYINLNLSFWWLFSFWKFTERCRRSHPIFLERRSYNISYSQYYINSPNFPFFSL